MDEGSDYRCERTEKCASVRFQNSYQLAVNSTCTLHLQLPLYTYNSDPVNNEGKQNIPTFIMYVCMYVCMYKIVNSWHA